MRGVQKNTIFTYMRKMRVLLYVLLVAVMCHAGDFSDKQMADAFKFIKKAKYKEAAEVLLKHTEVPAEQKDVMVTDYEGVFKKFFAQHGKALNYTKWKTKRLSNSFDETVYQINCDKSAWMLTLREYAKSASGSTFTAFRFVTEEDVFIQYGK